MKKILSMVLSLALLVALAIPSFAVSGLPTFGEPSAEYYVLGEEFTNYGYTDFGWNEVYTYEEARDKFPVSMEDALSNIEITFEPGKTETRSYSWNGDGQVNSVSYIAIMKDAKMTIRNNSPVSSNTSVLLSYWESNFENEEGYFADYRLGITGDDIPDDVYLAEDFQYQDYHASSEESYFCDNVLGGYSLTIGPEESATFVMENIMPEYYNYSIVNTHSPDLLYASIIYPVSGTEFAEYRTPAIPFMVTDNLTGGNQSGTTPAPKSELPTQFTDVPSGSYYTDAVIWALDSNLTTGTTATTFTPDGPCTRSQIVTFLWRAAGSPKPTTTSTPFTDVKSSDYFYDAILWAVEKGITTGTSATTFSPNAICTRGQAVVFLYRAAGSPKVSGTLPFTDVDSFYRDAVLWANQKNIVNGTSSTTFSPLNNCTRGQIVTMLHRPATAS